MESKKEIPQPAVTAPVAPAVVPQAAQQVDPILAAFRSSVQNYQPAFWDLTESEEDPTIINGRNIVTGLTFKGTRQQFGELLKGV